VPLDVLYGVPRLEKLERLLGLAARANVNLLRVWGGGLLESDELYVLCDRLGLLVWQEFSQSSSGLESVPSDDPKFVATLAADARAIVPRLAWHPSLAIWCGGNELDADDSHPALAALRGAVHELDPERAWLPTSPVGEKDVHGPWEHQGLRKHYEHYDTRTSLLHSEFGVEGMTNRRALEEVIAPEHRWPADRTNPVYEHLGAWWNNAPLVQEAFGGRIDDVETMRRASQWLQYEGLRYAVEATIRRAWQASGVLPWQFNEPFPNAWCTSAVDWWGNPKPAYFGVARAYRGAPSARLAMCAWGGLGEVRAVVSAAARLVDLDGRVVAEVPGAGEISAQLDAFAHDVFLLDLVTNRYVLTRTETLAPLLDLPETTLSLAGGVLTNGGDVAAIGVVTDGDVLDLLPGGSAAIEGERAEGWNARL
jgi:beta-mannosidase